jgi:hypothetical protein
MKADWDKLGDKYANSDSVMIVDVDCTADGKSTCAQQDVKGYPTIKYFMAGSKKGQDYQGGRDYAALSKFVESTLDIAKCEPLTGKNCKPNEKKFIEDNKDKSANELQEIINERNSKKKTTDDEFKAVEKQFKDAEKEYRKKEREYKHEDAKYKAADTLLKALLKSKQSAKKNEL